jgi:hypothetical protein
MILVDECRWFWRDRLWCHMVSDESLDELHGFAFSIGVPWRAFGGDHYDLHVEARLRAIEAGAATVSSRELVSRLRASGLRITPAQRRLGEVPTVPPAFAVEAYVVEATSASEATMPATGAAHPIHGAGLFQRGSSIT